MLLWASGRFSYHITSGICGQNASIIINNEAEYQNAKKIVCRLRHIFGKLMHKRFDSVPVVVRLWPDDNTRKRKLHRLLF